MSKWKSLLEMSETAICKFCGCQKSLKNRLCDNCKGAITHFNQQRINSEYWLIITRCAGCGYLYSYQLQTPFENTNDSTTTCKSCNHQGKLIKDDIVDFFELVPEMTRKEGISYSIFHY